MNILDADATINLCKSVSFNLFRYGLTWIWTCDVESTALKSVSKKITGKLDSANVN